MRKQFLQKAFVVVLLSAFVTACESPLLNNSGANKVRGIPGKRMGNKHGRQARGGNFESLFRGRGGSGQSGLRLGPRRASNGEVVVTLPKDRCKSGSIVFGNTRCVAMGRGLTRYSDPKSSKWQKGRHSNGTPCWFLKSAYVKGATPVTTFRSGALRPYKPDKMHWGQDGIRIHGNTGHRAGFVIHSVNGFTGASTAEKQGGFGCVRLPQSCMKKFRSFVNQGKRKVNVRVVER